MPALDGTGPKGQGPRTGRGLGNCPGCGGALPKVRRGRGFGLGLGRAGINNNVCCPLCPICQQRQDLIEKQDQTKEKDTNKKLDK